MATVVQFPPIPLIPPPFGAPSSIAELGLRESTVFDLFVKHALIAGTSTLSSLSASMKLAVEHTEVIFRKLRLQHLIEVKGTWGEDYTFCLTANGRNLANERMQVSRYIGPLPVPLSSYELAVRSQVIRGRINRQVLAEAYSDLSVPASMLDRLGPAMVSANSMFLYGPSGTGKSSLAERLLRVYTDSIAIPWAVEVEGNIISLFDRAVHRVTEPTPPDYDPRWLICARPSITVGGELMPSMLELQRDIDTGSFIAPLHMKANNGIFVIDDFGRQMIAPRDLLNRWIVPLDRRCDYLATSAGIKFPIPFEVFVVFSTNLDPSKLADEAFLRRIPNKILVDAVTPEIFDQIVDRRLASAGWTVEPGSREYLRKVCLDRGGDLRPCYPRDIFRIIDSAASFDGCEAVLGHAEIDRAADLYFAVLQ